MLCSNCGSNVAEGNRFCPNCGAALQATGFRKPAFFDGPTVVSERQATEGTERGQAIPSYAYTAGQYRETDPNRMRDIYREEAERAIAQSDVRRWADGSFLFGILSICFIAIGAGIIAIFLAFFFGVKSNKTADRFQLPREKKAKKGMILACVPFMVGALAGIVCGILAICGVI